MKLNGQFQKYNIIQSPAHRTATRGRGIGGLAILVNSSFFKINREIIHENFIIIDITSLESTEHLIIANVYIQPQRIKDEMLTQVFDQIKISTETNPDHKIIICGDLNARIGNSGNDMEESSFPALSSVRKSHDKLINQRGKILLDVCENNDLTILNSRTTKDLEGGFTHISSIGNSVIDLFLCNRLTLKYIKSLKVKQFTYSSHFPVCLQLGFPHNTESMIK